MSWRHHLVHKRATIAEGRVQLLERQRVAAQEGVKRLLIENIPLKAGKGNE